MTSGSAGRLADLTCARATVAPATIASYLKVGDNLLAWLRRHGMPTGAGGDRPRAPRAVPGGHGRPACRPPPTAKHYRSPAAALPVAGRRRRDRPLPHGTDEPAHRARAAGAHPRPTTSSARCSTPHAATPSRTGGTPPSSACFLDTGMRAGELAGLTVDDLDREQVDGRRDGQGWPRPRRARSAPRPPTPCAATSGSGPGTPWPPREALWLGKKRAVSPTPVSGRCSSAVLPTRGCRTRASAPVPAHLRPHLARRRRAGDGPDAAGRLAVTGDGRPVRRQRRRRTRPRGVPPRRARRPPVRRCVPTSRDCPHVVDSSRVWRIAPPGIPSIC